MIQSKEDYKYYLKADAVALNKNKSNYKAYVFDMIWKYLRSLRKVEYYKNCKNTRFNPFFYHTYLKYKVLGIMLGFTIPPNAFGPGLSIPHKGTIIVNNNAKIGRNCRIHNGVHIATNAFHPDEELKKGFVMPVPKIGNNVFIGPNVTIFGDIEIADGIAIGANSVVNKSFKEKNITIAGIPAKKVSNKGFDKCYFKATEIVDKMESSEVIDKSKVLDKTGEMQLSN